MTLFIGELKVIEMESFLQQVHSNTQEYRSTSADINVRHITEYCAELGSDVIWYVWQTCLLMLLKITRTLTDWSCSRD